MKAYLDKDLDAILRNVIPQCGSLGIAIYFLQSRICERIAPKCVSTLGVNLMKYFP